MKYLVTGVAGFIGESVASKLLQYGHEVVGVDNMNSYYDVDLKKNRLKKISADRFCFLNLDISNKIEVSQLFEEKKIDVVIHLAAQAGVRYSLENPYAYIDSNIQGMMVILETCRHFGVKHLVYASSSSVYGMNQKTPFSTSDSVDHPVSLYAATKKANELMAHTYSHLYRIPTTGLRFFTVYGPWGRPDMAPFKFTKAILEGKPIQVYNHGNMQRDFTYIDDITESVVRIADKVPEPTLGWTVEQGSPATSSAPYRIYNVGNGRSVPLMDFILALENAIGKEAIKEYLPMQPGDVHATWADSRDLFKLIDYRPIIPIETGVPNFVNWYRNYYNI